MKKFYINWFLVVTLFAIVGASIQSSIEWIHIKEEADERASLRCSPLFRLSISPCEALTERLQKPSIASENCARPSDEISFDRRFRRLYS